MVAVLSSILVSIVAFLGVGLCFLPLDGLRTLCHGGFGDSSYDRMLPTHTLLGYLEVWEMIIFGLGGLCGEACKWQTGNVNCGCIIVSGN